MFSNSLWRRNPYVLNYVGIQFQYSDEQSIFPQATYVGIYLKHIVYLEPTDFSFLRGVQTIFQDYAVRFATTTI